jgi:hypothetical protein
MRVLVFLLVFSVLACLSFSRKYSTRATDFDDLELNEINDKSLLVVLNASLQTCHETHVVEINKRCYFANEKAINKIVGSFSKYQKDPENPPVDRYLRQVVYEFLEGYAELYHGYIRCQQERDLHDTIFHHKFHFLLDQMRPRPHLEKDRLWIDENDSIENYYKNIIRAYEEDDFEKMGRVVGEMTAAVYLDNEGEVRERAREKREDEEEERKRAYKLRKMGVKYDPHDDL